MSLPVVTVRDLQDAQSALAENVSAVPLIRSYAWRSSSA